MLLGRRARVGRDGALKAPFRAVTNAAGRESMADPADANVDDLRRRARRRLVGAIVLALAAAVFVPMLLESDPKPLGEDVSVRIPPVDDGKFVNRLNDPSKSAPIKASPPKSESRPEAAKPDAMKSEPAKPEP